MKFGKTIRDKILKEWRFYSVDYKALKKALKEASSDDITSVDAGVAPSHEEFFAILEDSEQKLTRFYQDREKWAISYMKTLEEHVDELRALSVPATPRESSSVSGSTTSLATEDGDDSSDDGNFVEATHAVEGDLERAFEKLTAESKRQSFNTKQAWLKDQYRQMGKSKEFKAFIYARKSLATFERELTLLLDFLDTNKTAFSKILKKFDKRTASSIRDAKMAEIMDANVYLDGEVLTDLKEETNALIHEVNALKPQLPEGWESRKVYTIGCFDLFHRGHQNVLMSLREFGYYIVAGIHDDESYFKLKNKYTIDNLETRMQNVKPFVDQLYVIPSTDPLMYIQSMVSEQDIENGQCCYARGDDMLDFPGREWVESVMPVHFVPRTEACSSTLIRTIYHADSEEIRRKAAFAKTRYDGKPIDENGNVLKFTKPTVAASCCRD